MRKQQQCSGLIDIHTRKEENRVDTLCTIVHLSIKSISSLDLADDTTSLICVCDGVTVRKKGGFWILFFSVATLLRP